MDLLGIDDTEVVTHKCGSCNDKFVVRTATSFSICQNASCKWRAHWLNGHDNQILAAVSRSGSRVATVHKAMRSTDHFLKLIQDDIIIHSTRDDFMLSGRIAHFSCPNSTNEMLDYKSLVISDVNIREIAQKAQNNSDSENPFRHLMSDKRHLFIWIGDIAKQWDVSGDLIDIVSARRSSGHKTWIGYNDSVNHTFKQWDGWNRLEGFLYPTPKIVILEEQVAASVPTAPSTATPSVAKATLSASSKFGKPQPSKREAKCSFCPSKIPADGKFYWAGWIGLSDSNSDGKKSCISCADRHAKSS